MDCGERRETSGRPSPHDYTPEEIRKAVHEGVVGWAALLSDERQTEWKKKVDTLPINGCEGEPVLSADHRAIFELTDLMLYGIRLCKSPPAPSGDHRFGTTIPMAEHLRKEAKGIAEVVVPAVPRERRVHLDQRCSTQNSDRRPACRCRRRSSERRDGRSGRQGAADGWP